MTRVVMIRHGTTAWNHQGRIQGRRDLPLGTEGRAEVRAWRLPDDLRQGLWLASPLARARDTARMLLGRPVDTDARLIEMDWGAYEGARLAELRAADGVGMADNEASGLDFRPPGGESPREVAERLRALLQDLVGRPGPIVLVTHKGVLHAALVLATGWAMTGGPPVRLRRSHALCFRLDEDARLHLAGTMALEGR